jgi:hypothetical protein
MPSAELGVQVGAPRSTSCVRSSGVCGRNSNSAHRDSSAELISKYGFSVVAPISVIRPRLDHRQQRVLLGLVEAVDLVEEEDRAPAVRAEPLARPAEHRRHVGLADLHRRQLLELAPVAWAMIRASVVLPVPGAP